MASSDFADSGFTADSSCRRISRRAFVKATAGGALGGSMLAAVGCSDKPRSTKPNIILIMADDMGYECIGADGGSSYKTPAIDGLARGGMRFEHCYSQPICTPSRVQLMTGIYNVRNYVRFGVLNPAETTFGHLLKRGGYATCVVGKWQLGGGLNGPGRVGFDEYCLWQLNRRPSRYVNPGLEVNGRRVDYTAGEYGPDVVSNYACDFMRRNRNRPFLLYYSMLLPHCPFEPTPDSPDWDPRSKGSADYKGDVKYFPDMVAYADKMVARIARTLDELGLSQNTLLLFCADNGTDEPIVSMINGRGVAGAKGRMTDAGTHVPLIARWPGTIEAGRVCRELVDFSDFLPTMCEVAGVQVPAALALDGRSFLSQLQGRNVKGREWIYCWYNDAGGPAGEEYARNQRYKLYATGEFYDVQEDVLENNPLKEEHLGQDARKVHAMLQDVLGRYASARAARKMAVPGL